MIIKKFSPKVKQLLRDFPKKPSQWLANKLEKLTGLTCDFSEGDWGNGPRGGK